MFRHPDQAEQMPYRSMFVNIFPYAKQAINPNVWLPVPYPGGRKHPVFFPGAPGEDKRTGLPVVTTWKYNSPERPIAPPPARLIPPPMGDNSLLIRREPVTLLTKNNTPRRRRAVR